MTSEGKFKVVTRDDGQVQVIIPVAKVAQVDIGIQVHLRWYHNLTEHADQRMGIGYMRKRDAIDAVMVIVREQGWLPE